MNKKDKKIKIFRWDEYSKDKPKGSITILEETPTGVIIDVLWSEIGVFVSGTKTYVIIDDECIDIIQVKDIIVRAVTGIIDTEYAISLYPQLLAKPYRR